MNFCIFPPIQLFFNSRTGWWKNLYLYRNWRKLYSVLCCCIFWKCHFRSDEACASEDIKLKRLLIIILQLFQYQFIYASFTIFFNIFLIMAYILIEVDIVLPWENFKPFLAEASNFPITLCQNTCISHYRMFTNLRKTKQIL